MPLTNLFQKRSSQKNKKGKTSTDEKESQPPPKVDTTATTENVVSEVNEVLQEIITNVSSNITDVKVVKESNSTASVVASDGESRQSDSLVQSRESVPDKLTDINAAISSTSNIMKYEESTKNFSSEQSNDLISDKTANVKETNSIPSDAKNCDESKKHDLSSLETGTMSVKSENVRKISPASSNVANRMESSKNYSTTQSSDSAENDETDTFSKQKVSSKAPKQKKRSCSITHSEVHSEVRLKGRRKFGSEGEVHSINQKLFPVKQKKDLDEVIGKYVDKLIRDSIVKAVRNVNVDSLYEEIVKDFSNRRSSESAESVEDYVVEQRLSSHSISELVELETEVNEAKEDNADYSDLISQKFNQKLHETEINELEFDGVDHISLVGYLADYEDTTSVDDIKSIEENSSVCLSFSDFEGQAILNTNEKSMKKDCEGISKNFEAVSVAEKTTDLSKVEKGNNAVAHPPEVDLKESHQSEETTIEHETKLPSTKNTCKTEQMFSVSETSCQEQRNIPSSKKQEEKSLSAESSNKTEQNVASPESTVEQTQKLPPSYNNCEQKQNLTSEKSNNKEQKQPSAVNTVKEQDFFQKKVSEQEQVQSSKNSANEQIIQKCSLLDNTSEQQQKLSSDECNIREAEEKLPKPKSTNEEQQDLIVMSSEDEYLLSVKESKSDEKENPPPDIDENLPQQKICVEEERKVNWKAGYLHVKLPHKSRGKTHLKAWKKRCVAIQPDEFVNDPKNPSLVVSVYGGESKKHGASFWQTVSSQKAVVYRCSSRSHRYAFTISEEGRAIIHLSAESETATQEWMAAIRAVLWPPSPFMQLEKMLSGREFEISLIDNEFSYHAGLLGMYGYLTITPRKLILLHPQQGYVIQEWYLNTVDKFQLVPHPKAEDAHKILAMTTCSDSSTGKGEILLFCNEAVTLLQSLASTIHQVLTYHNKQEGGRYKKEMEEIAEWLIAPPQDTLDEQGKQEEHYKVPTRQVKSLLDIPNFIFEKSLSPVASAIYPAPPSADVEPLAATKDNPATASHDSGISTCTSSDDFLNCSAASFILGGGPLTCKSSDSELSDTYTPPRSPVIMKKIHREELKEEESPIPEASS